jgi:ABC-type multidrug transport system fused ATPase/permease subunit
MKLKGLSRPPLNPGAPTPPLSLTGRMLMDLLTARERRGFLGLATIMLLVGILETAGIASILPFMAVLAEPARIEQNQQLAAVYHGLGFESVNAFLVLLGFLTFAMTMVGIAMHILSIFSISRFTTQCSYMLSCQLLEGYLSQPYSWFLNRHSADLGKAVLSEVDNVVSQSFVPAMTLLSNLVVTLFVTAFLVALQPWVALGTAVVLTTSYGLIFVVARKYLARFGQIRFAANAERYKVAQEATAGIKDVKLLGLEARYMRRFQGPARRMARVSAARTVIATAPRYLLQGVAFGGMLLIILAMLIAQSASLGAILPLLAVYAFAGLRLLPAVQQVYEQITSLRYNQPALASLHKDIMDIRARAARPVEVSREPVRLNDRLELTDVHFSYPLAEDRKALNGLSLTIPARATVGIVGGTGAGKTTAVDLMLGLLDMQQGELRVDGVPITPRNVRAWQDTIGYVPQAIFLTDDSVAANIAFGLPKEQIDHAAVERAARTAELHDFVMGELPQGYDTVVGERGIRLSGGQRQRIGIARALYHDPDVLIMDEATSALDNLTERAVMDAVHNLGHAKTIILIAHRLTTVQACDTIFMLEHGRLVAQGSYNELLDTSRKFRAMAVGHAAG